MGGFRYHWFYFKRIFTFGTCAKITFFWDFKSGHTIIYNFSNIHTHTWFVNLHCQISKVPAYKECNLLKTGTTVTLTNQKFYDLFQADLKIRNKKQFGFMDHEMIFWDDSGNTVFQLDLAVTPQSSRIEPNWFYFYHKKNASSSSVFEHGQNYNF